MFRLTCQPSGMLSQARRVNYVMTSDTAGGAFVISRDIVDRSVASWWTNRCLGSYFSKAQVLVFRSAQPLRHPSRSARPPTLRAPAPAQCARSLLFAPRHESVGMNREGQSPAISATRFMPSNTCQSVHANAHPPGPHPPDLNPGHHCTLKYALYVQKQWNIGGKRT